MLTGSDFVAQYAKKGPVAWEAAALALARQGGLTSWPWVDLPLTDGTNTVVLKVMTDVLSVGPIGDHVRLPLTPGMAQSILNLTGSLLPTPWLVYQIWRAAQVKLPPIAMVPNKFQDLAQFAAHSALMDAAIAAQDKPVGTLRSGGIKSVVVSNIYKPGKVVIFGEYRPPPAPDVFDDGQRMQPPKDDRQPVQPKSNIHADGYWDYSHGIQAIGTTAIVNGQPMPTVELYQHPTLSKLVSNEGPVRVPRYPSKEPVVSPPAPVAEGPAPAARVYPTGAWPPTTPSDSEWALAEIARKAREG